MRRKLFTKSRFKLALDCPAKLFYEKNNYPNTQLEDSFLQALAEGGFQVGELAKLYFSGGTDIKTLDYDEAIRQTNELLKNENVVIYEGAFKFKNLFIRADILVKKGNKIQLVEVKAKSFGGNDSNDFLNKSGYLASGWKPYLYDVAFQKYVLTGAFPDFEVSSFLMLADKKAKASINGLNQMFILKKTKSGRTFAEFNGNKNNPDLGEKILIQINVDDIIDKIFAGTDMPDTPEMSFVNLVNHYADSYMNNIKIKSPAGKHCKYCEFRCSKEDELKGLKNGFKECWKENFGFTDKDFKDAFAFDIWNFRKTNELLEKRVFHIKDVEKEDLGVGKSAERQWLQVEKVKNDDFSPFIDIEGLKNELSSWKYPLHFIDFETSAVAIPFNKGRKPYEGIAFQFSHHIVYEDGTIEHKGQYLNREQGVFPNFDFVRALKKELENDNGSVFKYSAHENTYLNLIRRQLKEMPLNEVPDKNELISFIETITHPAGSTSDSWTSPRDMIDMLEVVKNYYYHPIMKGSNSIKVVLPAVLNSSEYLQNKYSKPVYGKNKEIKSLNFNEMIWIKKDNGEVINPYKLLPEIFEETKTEKLDNILTAEPKLSDGGAAMTAYARMQFTEMTEFERNKLSNALLRYCELDTLAMVFIWEYWADLIK